MISSTLPNDSAISISWCEERNRSVNVKKSSVIGFSNKCGHVRWTKPNLLLNGEAIAQVLNTLVV